MIDRRATEGRVCRGLMLLVIAGTMTLGGVACNTGGNSRPDGTTTDSGGGNGNVLLNETFGFDGTLSAKVVDTQSTRSSLTDTSAQQAVPLGFDTESALVYFRDLMGNPLLDAEGNPIPPVQMKPDGTFDATGLPVGVDFTCCVDIGDNGACDIESCVNIPSDDGGPQGAIDGVQIDPLTTLVLAKLRKLIEEKGLDPKDLPVSPVAVATRIVDAYTNLFEESGIDQELTLDDFAAVTAARLSELFDTLIPSGVRSGMDVVEGNLDLARARAGDLNARALAIAEVFLRAGFPIADGPGQPDLSELGALDGVETTTARELFDQGRPSKEDFAGPGGGPDGLLAPAEFGDGPFEPVPVYFDTHAEPDRNFGNSDEQGDGETGPQVPLLHDYLLRSMARLHDENRRISLADLWDLLVSIDDGLGVRLTYVIFDPNFHGPPLNVFETENGEGKAINVEAIFRRIMSGGFEDLDPDAFDRREGELRSLIGDLLRGTVPPTFERLFKAIARGRVGAMAEFADGIRNARAHLPFSRSGPSEFFVVADGDPFRTDGDASPITVDADVTIDGDVLALEYNPDGTGQFWLGFGPRTDEGGFVELIVRETGNFLQGRRGPVRVSIRNDSLFRPVNGQPFSDFVSETGVFFPGINVTVIRDDFVPEPFAAFPDPGFDGPFPPGTEFGNDGSGLPPIDEPIDVIDVVVDEVDGEPLPVDVPAIDEPAIDTGSADVPADVPADPATPDAPAAQMIPHDGPNEQIFVLATDIGPNAEPVRVDYDRATGMATFNPGGRHLLMFLPDSDKTGLFALFNEKTGRPAGNEDPPQFFEGPIEQPDRFEDFFNNYDESLAFDNPDQLGEFVDGFINDIAPDEVFFPTDQQPFPPDGEFFPPDGELFPTDEPFPPPLDEVQPPLEPAEFDGEALDGFPPPNEFDDGNGFFDFASDVPVEDFVGVPPSAGFDFGFDIVVSINDVIGLPLRPERFTQVFGTNVPNERYDPAGDPFYDDVNGNREEDPGEPTAQFRPVLFDSNDWRSTDIRLYYRRADNNASVTFDEINFESPSPTAADGVSLVPRNYLPRLNAFRFGRPNTAINLLTAFLPPDFFDGTHTLDRDTKIGVLPAIAMINLVMDQVFNIEADIDIDGLGPLQRRKMLIDANLFVTPVGDPFVMLLKGFDQRSAPVADQP